MASDTLAELLGLDPATPRPNAYQLFGLQNGESDQHVIARAVQATLQGLKEAQSSSDPKAWKQAAAAVTRARKILTDGEAKAAYDAKLNRRPQRFSLTDPLAGLLPRFDPLAPFDVAAAADRIATLKPPQPPISVPEAASIATGEAASDAATPSPPAEFSVAPQASAAGGLGDGPRLNLEVPPASASRRGSGRRRGRRGVPWAALILAFSAVGMLSGIVFGIYMLYGREQQTAQRAAAPRPTPPAAPIRRPPPQTVDPVMGSLSSPAGSERGNTSGNLLSEEQLQRLQQTSPPQASPPASASSETMTESQGADGESKERDGDSQEASEEMEGTEPDAPEGTITPPNPANDPVREAGEAAIAAAEQAILENRWTGMKALAARAVQEAAGTEQKARAQRLFQVAELADYYYVGLMQSLQKLNAGDQIELENIGLVGIVEANETTLAIQVSGRPKSFSFDKIPFFVVDAIARLSMDLSDPSTRAAKAIHQAISLNATPSHRLQALTWLADLPQALPDADPAELQKAIHELYPNL